jgi:hypothetical protein
MILITILRDTQLDTLLVSSSGDDEDSESNEATDDIIDSSTSELHLILRKVVKEKCPAT